jgi:predicted PurR-regulated permease PerM
VVVVLLTALALLAALYLLWELRQLLRWGVIAVFLAVALDPAVDWLQRRRLPRSLAILLLYLALLLLIVGLVALLVPPLLAQARALGAFIVRLAGEPTGASGALQDLANRYGLGDYVGTLRGEVSRLPGRLGSAASPLLSVTRGIFGSVTALFSILLLTFFLLLDGERFVRAGLQLLSPDQRSRARRILDESARAIAGYITGNIVISLIAGGAAFVVLEILRMPYAVALALVVSIFDLIPLIGASLGALVVIIVGLFVSPVTAAILVAYFVIYQQIENNVLQPLVYGRSVNLHPLVVFVAAVAGAQLLGILGALMAIPVAEIIRILGAEWLAARRGASDARESEVPPLSSTAAQPGQMGGRKVR